MVIKKKKISCARWGWGGILGKLMLKRAKHSNGCLERVFKDSVRERVIGYMISLCIILCLVDGEVMG